MNEARTFASGRSDVRASALRRAPAAPLSFRSRDGHWWLWRPCPDCGGVVVPLRRPIRHGPVPCPECETRRRRIQPPGRDPAVWYDTWAVDWVVRVPGEEMPDGALMPLEIGWYDAGWGKVHRAAADLVYGVLVD